MNETFNTGLPMIERLRALVLVDVPENPRVWWRLTSVFCPLPESCWNGHLRGYVRCCEMKDVTTKVVSNTRENP